MNKILLVLIITSGFLLIIYANNDIFNHKNLFSAVSVFQRPAKTRTPTTLSTSSFQHENDIDQNYNGQQQESQQQQHLDTHYLQKHSQHQLQQHKQHYNASGGQHLSDAISSRLVAGGSSNSNNIGGDIRRIKYIPNLNGTEYNIFIIYTKENHILKNKLELFLKSLFKYTTIQLHLHIVTDIRSEQSLEVIIKSQINRYKKVVFYTLYDVNDSANKINDIVHSMMPLFSYAGTSHTYIKPRIAYGIKKFIFIFRFIL